ncbi:hypothetical protein [Fusobacterium sp.]|uniref:hypothetical protein n=1 Tax=Fusobacterium sp. TaxID=68766 RepID=UPI00262045F6|nr:hypothetical protein [Fusobacterium sp.]
MEKILKNSFDFVKNNVIKTILATILLAFNYLFLEKATYVSILTPIFKLLKIEQSYLYYFFAIVINNSRNILIIYIIYLILFGRKKAELENHLEKSLDKGKKVKRFLILILVLIALNFLNYIVLANFKGDNMIIFENTFIYHSEDWQFGILTIKEKLKILFMGTSYLLIRGSLAIFVTLNLLSVFTILEDKGESNFSVVNMLKHFSKTVSKKVAIFISYIFIVMDTILISKGSILLKSEYSFLIPFETRFPLNSLDSPFKLPYIIVVFGIILIFVLIKTILESDEMLVTTKVLKNKNIKYYLTNFFCLLLTQGLVTILLVYVVYISFILIGNSDILYLPMVFIVLPILTILISILFSLELIIYKINFKYLGENVKINFKKFLKSMGISFVICISYMAISTIIWVMAENMGYFIKAFLVIGGFILLTAFYLGFLLFIMKNLSILRGDKKVALKIVKRLINSNALIIIAVALSYVLTSIGLMRTYTTLNPILYYVLFFLMRCYLNLSLCDYYLRVVKEEIKTDDDKNIEIENTEKENIEEDKTIVIVEEVGDNDGEEKI